MFNLIVNALYEYVIKNWRTTATGLLMAIVWASNLFGWNLTPEAQKTIEAVLIAVFGYFAKDGKNV